VTVKLGTSVHLLDKARGRPAPEPWIVWSQAPKGYWVYRRTPDGKTLWEDAPTNRLQPCDRKCRAHHG
jgi:hypothetical protein